ncbi:MAG: hypothetical protein IOC39_33540 [Burkholderia sp.]|uniref:hypothetical protein n=1 Tax=Burkholderia sp. TaxID=36773 RepID=UPI002587C279|nr:hypothetical protein [Burkholderia sp.]MCA3782026.1 hypothetical protein [Burkholderia sp.]MCA3783634.1 hypothetical protein [Burkholderia sp.]MCA3796967.1 hypothetical protein [Burkholderia sp.]MCA3805691.1 hypothetical protein [Burkholderia sp.]MCA3811581.1 hypothetical protein [Burkholderia sp.]
MTIAPDTRILNRDAPSPMKRRECTGNRSQRRMSGETGFVFDPEDRYPFFGLRVQAAHRRRDTRRTYEPGGL